MASIVKLIRNRLFAAFRRGWGASLAVLACVIAAPALVYAHGGMGPDEIGPPIVTSGLLGFVSYWVVMLWPSSKRKDDPEVGSGRQSGYASRTERHSPKHTARVKRAPRLRKIVGSGQFNSDQQARRKASDG